MANYHPVWNAIKSTGCAEITVSKVNCRSAKTGVIDCKKKDNAARKLAGLPRFPKLVIEVTELSQTMVKIRFELLYSIKL